MFVKSFSSTHGYDAIESSFLHGFILIWSDIIFSFLDMRWLILPYFLAISSFLFMRLHLGVLSLFLNQWYTQSQFGVSGKTTHILIT